jgi:NADH:ubiquinone oxidoreductase subunit K
MSFFVFGLVGLSLYQFVNMWFYSADTMCNAINFIDVVNIGKKVGTVWPGV